VVTATKDEDEMRKRIDAAVLAGDAVVAIDNYDSPIQGSAICTALSQPMLKPRVLGKSELVQVANTFSFHGTGNNLTVEGDATRRVLVSLLDAQVERPELRRFTFNVIEEVREQRAVLAVAALTVVRAYLLSGAGELATPLGGYEEWSHMVRDALVWLDEPDPVDVMERVRAADPLLANLKAMVAAWQEAFGDQKVLARQVIDKATDGKHQDLNDALAAVAGDDRGIINARWLGYWLRSNKDKVVLLAGVSYRLTQAGVEHRTATWQVVRVERDAPRDQKTI
jgi:putative DNA primase/helicase